MNPLARITDETTPRRAAELYREAGFDPIPIHGIVDGKCARRLADAISWDPSIGLQSLHAPS